MKKVTAPINSDLKILVRYDSALYDEDLHIPIGDILSNFRVILTGHGNLIIHKNRHLGKLVNFLLRV